MLEYFYEWMENLAFYLVIITIVVQMLPNNSYKKYIRFFTGLILILLMMNPILKILGTEQAFFAVYESEEYRQKVREIEQATKYLEGFSGEVE